MSGITGVGLIVVSVVRTDGGDIGVTTFGATDVGLTVAAVSGEIVSGMAGVVLHVASVSGTCTSGISADSFTNNVSKPVRSHLRSDDSSIAS